jgi:hypothetical protein
MKRPPGASDRRLGEQARQRAVGRCSTNWALKITSSEASSRAASH